MAGTASRTAHLLTVMNRGDDPAPGSAGALPGINHPHRAPREALAADCGRTRWLSARITQPA